ncbi:MAG: TRAP transporter TatT component family protein [Thermodesulfobacteriota bacterium]
MHLSTLRNPILPTPPAPDSPQPSRRLGLAWPRGLALLACLLVLAGLAWPVPAQALLSIWPYRQWLQGEALFAQRADLNKAGQAAQRYRRVLAEQPGNLRASLRLVHTLVWLAAHQEDEGKMSLLKEAVQVADRAARRHPQDLGVLYWQGVAAGLLADNSGPVKAYKLVQRVERNMKRLLALDPAFEYGGACRVLGRLYTKLPWFMGGDRRKAELYLKRAVKLGPRYWINYLYLADLYRQQGRDVEARRLLRRVVAGGPAPSGQEAESQAWQELAAGLLAQKLAPPRD